MESAYQSRAQSRMSQGKIRVLVSALKPENDFTAFQPGLRVYIPFGQPSYSYYYSLDIEEVRNRQDVTVAETLQALSVHMQTEGEYSLAVQRSLSSALVRLYDSERPAAVVIDR